MLGVNARRVRSADLLAHWAKRPFMALFVLLRPFMAEIAMPTIHGRDGYLPQQFATCGEGLSPCAARWRLLRRKEIERRRMVGGDVWCE